MLQTRLLALLFISTPTFVLAQVGIGTTSPDASAQLDVTSGTKGFLPPKVALTATNSASPITNPATGLLVYNTATAGSSPNNVVPGYYYNSGTTSAPSWKRLATVEVDNTFKLVSTGTVSISCEQSIGSSGYTTLSNTQLQVTVPSGFSTNRIVLQWNIWGDVISSAAAGGSLRFRISQSTPSSSTISDIMMTGWNITSGLTTTRWAAPTSYILTNVTSGNYTFNLEVQRESETGTINSVRKWGGSGNAQVFVQ